MYFKNRVYYREVDIFFFYFFQDFENICGKLIGKYFEYVEVGKTIIDKTRENIIDIYAKNEDDSVAIFEVKFYESQNKKIDLFENACRQLRYYGNNLEVDNLYFIVNLKVDDFLKEKLRTQYSVIVIDIENLLFLSKDYPGVKKEIFELLDSTFEDYEEKEFYFGESDFTPTISKEVTKSAESEYIDKILQLNCGIECYKVYEELMCSILKYLFDKDLVGWHKQYSTEDGINRYDLICRIYNEDSIWRIFVNDFKSRYILFEFKNYKNEITQREIYTTEKYLFKTAKRSVGFIISRKGPSINSKKATDAVLRENGKLLIHLSDEDMIKLLEMYEEGTDPRDYLLVKLDECLMKLSK